MWTFVFIAIFCAIPVIYFHRCNEYRKIEHHYWRYHRYMFFVLEVSYLILFLSLINHCKLVLFEGAKKITKKITILPMYSKRG